MLWLWGILGLGWAQEFPGIDEVGIVCQTQMQSTSLSLFIQGKRYQLNDDGIAPDTHAKDGISSVFIPTQGEGKAAQECFERPCAAG